MNGDARWYELTPGGVAMILVVASAGGVAVTVMLAVIRVLS